MTCNQYSTPILPWFVLCIQPCRVPYLRAPFYAWVGRPWADSRAFVHHEQKVERPALFPPTFLYTQSWEDPEPDMKVGKGDSWTYLSVSFRVFRVITLVIFTDVHGLSTTQAPRKWKAAGSHTVLWN